MGSRHMLSLAAAVMAAGAALSADLPAAARPRGVRGMWVWREAAIATDAARNTLMAFCQQHAISHIDVHVSIGGQDGSRSLRAPEALGALLDAAAESGLTVGALRGAPDMFSSQRRGRALEDLQVLLNVTRTRAPGRGFSRIKYDVEPYASADWREGGDARRRLQTEYLETLILVREALRADAPGVRLAADVPFWWDNAELAIEFEGKRAPFVHHVQDLTDTICIMSYRRDPDDVLRLIEGELAHARTVGTRVFASLETGKLDRNAHISFWGQPAEALRAAERAIQEAHRRHPAFGGVMLHHYDSLVELLGGAEGR